MYVQLKYFISCTFVLYQYLKSDQIETFSPKVPATLPQAATPHWGRQAGRQAGSTTSVHVATHRAGLNAKIQLTPRVQSKGCNL